MTIMQLSNSFSRLNSNVESRHNDIMSGSISDSTHLVEDSHVKVESLINSSPGLGILGVERALGSVLVGQVPEHQSIRDKASRILQTHPATALDSFITKSPSFTVGMLCWGFMARNSGFMCSPAMRSTTLNSYSRPRHSAVMLTILQGAERLIP